MARALIAALEQGGHTVELASRLRLHLSAPDPDAQSVLARTAEAEAARLTRSWRERSAPDLWFTYHNHYKAPDLLGPSVAASFGIPYAVAEASHAPRRAEQWGSWFAAAEHAICAADLHVCLTRRDRDGIAPLLRHATRVLDLPPFIDLAGLPAAPVRTGSRPVCLITVAMMRPGDKLDSYRFLAAALALVADLDWTLAIVGDGPARVAVEQAFSGLPAERLAWHGTLASDALLRRLADSDVFVWPGFGEAFGLAYLEAGAMGLPVVALDVAGVSSVVIHGRTGLLVGDAAPDRYGSALATLIRDDDQRRRLGRAASSFVRQERTVDRAAGLLDGVFNTLQSP